MRVSWIWSSRSRCAWITSACCTAMSRAVGFLSAEGVCSVIWKAAGTGASNSSFGVVVVVAVVVEGARGVALAEGFLRMLLGGFLACVDVSADAGESEDMIGKSLRLLFVARGADSYD